MAHVLGAQFKRIQFTPDTSPDEMTGVNADARRRAGVQARASSSRTSCSPTRSTARLRGCRPRCSRRCRSAPSPSTAARHQLPDPFLVIATQNPYEHEGIFPLPESQLDRFLFKVDLDYADAESEMAMLQLPHTGVTPDMLGEIRALLGVVGIERVRGMLDLTQVPDEVARYIVRVVRHTRENPTLELGASSRAAIHLLSASKANARLDGRDFVTSRTSARWPHTSSRTGSSRAVTASPDASGTRRAGRLRASQ